MCMSDAELLNLLNLTHRRQHPGIVGANVCTFHKFTKKILNFSFLYITINVTLIFKYYFIFPYRYHINKVLICSFKYLFMACFILFRRWKCSDIINKSWEEKAQWHVWKRKDRVPLCHHHFETYTTRFECKPFLVIRLFGLLSFISISYSYLKEQIYFHC